MTEAAYEQDFYAWTQDQARRLREAGASRVNLAIDFDNLAEEVESLGKRDFRSAEATLMRILEHLLKLEHSSAADPRATWRRSVRTHRRRLAATLDDSPSFRGRIDPGSIYRTARANAGDGLRQDGLSEKDLPEHCPYPLTDVLAEDWWPANRHGIED